MRCLERWIGYQEHLTADDLRHYQSNVGKGGCTIFAEMILAAQGRNLQGMPWCVTFVHAVIARPDILGKAHPGSRVMQRRMKRKRLWRGRNYVPEPGDLIFLSNDANDRVDHCGIVDSVDKDTVISVDGNTVDETGTFSPEQGGVVARQKRPLSDPRIVGYGAIGHLWINGNR